MTEQDVSQPSMQDFVDRGDFRRAAMTREFASLSLGDQFHTLSEAVKIRIGLIKRSNDQTGKSLDSNTRLLDELGRVEQALEKAATIATTGASAAQIRNTIYEEIRSFPRQSSTA